MKLKKVLERKREYWFGNGRFFGFQIGSVEEKLADPYYRDDRIIGDYWQHGQFTPSKPLGCYHYGHSVFEDSLSENEVKRLTDILASKINNGTADIELIRRLNLIGRGSMEPIDESTFKEWSEDPLTLYHIFHEILERASTVESVPYLLEALESQQVVKYDPPFKKEPEKLICRDVRNETRSEGDYKTSWDDHYEVTYDIYKSTCFHKVILPFAEFAKSGLFALMKKVKDKQLKTRIGDAIEKFDETKPKIHQKEHTREEEVGREYKGWTS